MAINLPIVSKFVDKGVKDAEGAFGGLGKSLGKLGGLIAATFSVTAITNFAKDALAAAEGVAVANNRLDQVAESMGLFGAQTQAVSDRLKEYAEANELNVGVDAEVIKATQAKLLTFKELAVTAGDAGAQFDRATQAALDLAATGFGTAETNAVQLGKALNDPVKGISALARSGITFTKEQKNLIKAMVETSEASAAVAVGLFENEGHYNSFIKAQIKAGVSSEEIDAIFRDQLTPANYELMHALASTSDMAGAQEMVLKAIEQQVGGTAEATATASEKMALAFDNVKETVGEALLPVFEEMISSLLPIVQELGPKLANIFTKLSPIFGVVAQIIPLIADAFFALVEIIEPLVMAIFPLLVELIRSFLPIITQLLKDVFVPLAPAIIAVVQAITPLLLLILPPLIDLIKNFLIPVLQFVTTVFTDIVVNGIDFFTDGLTNLSSFINDFQTTFETVWNEISGFVKKIINNILGFIQTLINGVVDGVNKVIDALNSIKVTIPDFVPVYGGSTFSLNLPKLSRINIPRLAEGGIVMPQPGGVLANLAEAGRPEAVIPLDRLGNMGGNQNTYNINVNAGMGANGTEIGRKIVDEIIRYERASGRVFARA
jgi:phage-related protein